MQIDNEVHGSDSSNATCVTVRRYAGMALTNLTFGDCNNKALLCSMRGFLAALVAQLQSPSEDLRQVTLHAAYRIDFISLVPISEWLLYF